MAGFKMSTTYFLALRPWSFTATLTAVALGTAVAYRAVATFHLWTLLTTCLTALSIHAAGNLINTYFDYIRGVDSKKSDDKTLVNGVLNPRDIAVMACIFYAIGISSFAFILLFASSQQIKLVLIFICGVLSSFFYTGGLGLKYIALGDVLIFLTFGPIVVLFAYFTQGAGYTITPLMYAIPLALNTEAILHSNNVRDMDSDRRAGITTLAILIGMQASYRLFQLLLFIPYLVFIWLILLKSLWYVLPLLTLPIALQCQKALKNCDLRNMPENIAKLNLPFGLLYVLAYLMA